MIIDATCSKCKRAYRLPDTQLGKRVRCKGCGDTFVVVAEDEVPVLEEASDADVRRAAKKQREEQAVEVLDDVEEFEEDEERVAAAPKRRARRDEEEDDRPRRSRRDRDEDEDERPRRARRKDEDDEEEEEEPQKKGGGALVVLGIVAAALLLLCGGGGGLAYYASRKAADNAVAGINNIKPDEIEQWKNGLADQDKGKVNPPNQDGGKINNPPNNDGGKVNNPPNNDNQPPRDINAALAMLKDNDAGKKRQALQFLNTVAIESSRVSDVEKAVGPLESDVQFLDDAGKVLDRSAPSGKIDRYAKLLESKNANVYLRAMDRLSNINEDRAAEVLANQFKESGRENDAARYLPRMGKLCEKYVLAHYNSGGNAQAPARRVLDQIGTTNEARVRQCVTDFEGTTQVLEDKSPQENSRNQRRQAIVETLQKLKPTKEIDLNEQVSKQLEPALSDKNPFLVDAAFKAMETWLVKDSVPAIIDLARKDVSRRGKAVKLLIKFPEQEKVPPFLVELLLDASQRDTAGKALIAMGGKGEKAILDAKSWIGQQRDVQARRTAYLVLAAVGTKASLGPLKEFVTLEARAGDKGNAVVAENARKAIQRREGLKVDTNPPKDKVTPKDKVMPKDKVKPKDKIK